MNEEILNTIRDWFLWAGTPGVFMTDDGELELRWVKGDQVFDITATVDSAYIYSRSTTILHEMVKS